MSTNDNGDNDTKQVTEEDLRNLKYGKDGVEDSKETDETEQTEEAAEESEETSDEAGQTDDEATDESEDSDEFVKQVPSIKGESLEEYARNLEVAYQNSTKEALRLKGLAESKTERVGDNDEEVDVTNPLSLYAKQKMDEEILQEFTDFSKRYPQVKDPAEYAKFTTEVSTLSSTILQTQKRLASPKELYRKAAAILDWEPDQVDGKDKLGAVLKNSASVTRTSSSVKKPAKSDIPENVLALDRIMFPNKTDEQRRKELKSYIK